MARKFFVVCAGLLCLAIAFHFGATTAGAQAPSNPVVSTLSGVCGYQVVVFTANGDILAASGCTDTFTHLGNVFTGHAVNVQKGTLGELKAKYR